MRQSGERVDYFSLPRSFPGKRKTRGFAEMVGITHGLHEICSHFIAGIDSHGVCRQSVICVTLLL